MQARGLYRRSVAPTGNIGVRYTKLYMYTPRGEVYETTLVYLKVGAIRKVGDTALGVPLMGNKISFHLYCLFPHQTKQLISKKEAYTPV